MSENAYSIQVDFRTRNQEESAGEIPNDETLAAFAELDNGGGEWFNGSTEDYIAKLYRYDEDGLFLYRMGTHSDLFR